MYCICIIPTTVLSYKFGCINIFSRIKTKQVIIFTSERTHLLSDVVLIFLFEAKQIFGNNNVLTLQINLVKFGS